MEQVQGDKELLVAMAGLFIEDYSDMVADTQQGFDDLDSVKVAEAVHALKGSVAALMAPAALDAALATEAAARRGDLAGAQESFALLRMELSRLADALRTLQADVATGGA